MRSNVWMRWVLLGSGLALGGCPHAHIDEGSDAGPDATDDAGASPDASALAPTVHATGLGQAEALLLDERALVWANKTQGTIQILDLATGAVRTLASGIAGPDHALAMDATHVYWAGWRDGSLMRVAREGGASELVATLPASALPNGMAISSTHVYWTYFGGAVARFPLGGGSVEEIPWGSTMVGTPRIHGDYLYATGSTDVRRLRIGPEAGAALISEWETLATFEGSAGGPDVFVVDDAFVYGVITNDSLVFRVPVGGGGAEIIARDLQPVSLAIDGGWLYMTHRGSYGLARMPLAGFEPIEQLAADSRSWGLAVGGGRIYWSSHTDVDSFDGTLQSIPTP